MTTHIVRRETAHPPILKMDHCLMFRLADAQDLGDFKISFSKVATATGTCTSNAGYMQRSMDV